MLTLLYFNNIIQIIVSLRRGNSMHMDKEFLQNLNLGKPALVEHFGGKKAEAILQKAKGFYNLLKPDIPNFKSAGNRMLFKMMFYILPLYKALLQEATKDQALDITRECFFKVLDSEFNSSWILRKVHSSPFLIRLLRRWIIRNINSTDEPEGWKYEKLTFGKSHLYGFTVKRCGICTFFTKMEMPELVPMICEGDYYIMKYFPKGVQLKRTQTIAEGAESCDFYYGFE